MNVRADSVLLRGGLDKVTPAIAMQPGMCIGASNYEPEVTGYKRLAGYERFDGRPRPSQASYWWLRFDAGTAAITDGQTVTGATSGATGIAVGDAVVETGSYGGSDAAGYLILRGVTGTFQDNENLQVSASTRCVADGVANERGAPTDAEDVAALLAAVEARRALIGAVPGSGPIRGLCVLNGVLHAIRDNAGATAGVLHKATASGWTAQSLGHTLDFTAGSAEFFEGYTITGGTSGATATVRRVVLLSGSWGGTAAGFLVLSGITGTFSAAETITGSPAGSATASGAQAANTIPAGGKYDFTVHNFYGAAFSSRMYAANGVGRAFEWDGTYFTPIRTGIASALDKPTRISQFANHLFLGYNGGSLIFSEPGTPTQFSTTAGAGEITFGSDFAAIVEATSTALVLFGRSKVAYVVGADSETFAMQVISNDSGAVSWTAQVADSPIYMDDDGVRKLSTTQAFGNWRVGTLTQRVEPLFKQKDAAGVTAVASLRLRAKDQYRLFFSDGSGFIIYLGREQPEIMPFDYGLTINTACAGPINSEQVESYFIGTDEGWVFEIERGRNFDGGEIFAYLRLAFNSTRSPQIVKRWHGLTLECEAQGQISLSFIPEFAYANADSAGTTEQTLSIAGGGAFWNDTAVWNRFYWSSQIVGEAHAHIDGSGKNMSIAVISKSTNEDPHTLSAATVRFSYRGMERIKRVA